MDGEREEETSEWASLMRAAEREDEVFLTKVEQSSTPIEEVGDAGERREVLSDLGKHVDRSTSLKAFLPSMEMEAMSGFSWWLWKRWLSSFNRRFGASLVPTNPIGAD